MLGGGYVGVEMAQAYRRFGSRVTIIEPGRQLMGREDPDVAQEMQRILSADGIEILLGAEPTAVRGLSGDAVAVALRSASGERKIDGSHLLVAVGRTPNTADIGLERAGLERDARGYIRVNERLETTAAGVWAIGEWIRRVRQVRCLNAGSEMRPCSRAARPGHADPGGLCGRRASIPSSTAILPPCWR